MASIAHLISIVKIMAARITPWDLVLVALATPLLLFPSGLSPLAALLLLLPWVARLLSTGRLSLPTPFDGALLALLATALLGLCVSPDRGHSLPRFWSILLGLALFYALANHLRSGRALRLVGDLAVAAGLALALLTLLGTDWLAVRLLDQPWYGRLPALLRDPGDNNPFNPRIMGQALAMLAPLTLALVFFGHGFKRRLLAGVVALVMVAVLILTQAVQAVLGLAAALFLLALWRSRWFLLLLPLGLILVLVAVLAYGPQRLAVDLLSDSHLLGVAVVLRLDMWSRALAMIRDLPFTGIGLDVFPLVQTGHYPGVLLGPEPHAHNLYLQLALDLGLPGLLAFFWLMAALALWVVRGRRCEDAGSRALLAGSAAGIVAYLASGLIAALWATKPGLLFWLLLGLAFSAARPARAEPVGVGRRRFLPLAGLAGLTFLAFLILPGLRASNLGSLQAHRALDLARVSGAADVESLRRAAAHLERALQARPDNAQTCRTLGQLYAWLGDDARALEILDRGVRLDGRAPLSTYAPWLLWLRHIQGQDPGDPWADLSWIYAHWWGRYPRRAEFHAQSALLWDNYLGDPAQARAILEAGLAEGAQPPSLLPYYLSQGP